jgi:peptidoglycan DL-endopeptidase LytF
MDLYQNHLLRKLSDQSNEYELILYLDNSMTEFSSELGTQPKAKQELLFSAKQLIMQKYPNIKVTTVRIIIGGMMIAGFTLEQNTAAAEITGNNQPVQANDISSPILYQVISGDTLWTLSRKFNTSVDDLKKANKLSSDRLMINQQLIIPKFFYSVKSGDSLSEIARDNNTSVNAIKEANHLTSDAIFIGQILTIPMAFGASAEKAETITTPTPAPEPVPAPVPVTPPSGETTVPATNQRSLITHTVQSGDNI